jgi:hypothetical protein
MDLEKDYVFPDHYIRVRPSKICEVLLYVQFAFMRRLSEDQLREVKGACKICPARKRYDRFIFALARGQVARIGTGCGGATGEGRDEVQVLATEAQIARLLPGLNGMACGIRAGILQELGPKGCLKAGKWEW